MDRFPIINGPETQDSEEEILRRKKRLFERLRIPVDEAEDSELRVVDLSDDAEEQGPTSGELFSRDSVETGSEEVDSTFVRVQELGRIVVDQSREVNALTDSLAEKLDSLPGEAKEAVKSETDHLKEASAELGTATEELDEELDNLEEAINPESKLDDESTATPEPVGAGPETSKPGKDHSEAMGMAQLVLATIMGGGIGAIVGESLKSSKERRAAKEKATMAKKIGEQKAKIEAQEAEIGELKAKKPDAGSEPEKEYIKKATELAETQTVLTQNTVEQVKAATNMATESERMFRLPGEERLEKSAEAAAEIQGIERMNEKNSEQLGEISNELSRGSQGAQDQQTGLGDGQKSSSTQPVTPLIDKVLTPKTWIYGLLLAATILLALSLLIFG